jgi:hypothetical protein
MDEDFTNFFRPSRFIQRANMSIDAPGNDINPYQYSDIKINPLNSFQGAFEPTSINPYQHLNPPPFGNPLNSFQGAFEPTSMQGDAFSTSKLLQKRCGFLFFNWF